MNSDPWEVHLLPKSSATIKSTLGLVGLEVGPRVGRGVVEMVSLSARERPGREERRRKEVCEFGKRERAPFKILQTRVTIICSDMSSNLEKKDQSVARMEGIFPSRGANESP